MTGNFKAFIRAGRSAVAVLAVLTGGAYAQQGHVTGPQMGYVFDGPARAVRPVLGVPGSSVMGGALQFGYDLAAVSISPSADWGVATAADGALHFVRFSGGSAAEISFSGSSVKPDRVVFSPSGASVALIAGGHVQTFSGFPSSATLVATMDLVGATAQRLQAESVRRPVQPAASIALSDDGAWLLTVAGGSVQLVGSGGSHAIGAAGRLSLVAFAPAGHDAVLADPSARSLTLLRNTTDALTAKPLWQDVSIAGAQGLAFSADGKSLFLASRAGQPVTIFDLNSGARTGVSCDCTATGLTRFGNLYRLNELTSGPLWLLDANTSEPRTVFVPASSGSN
jgi:hypothetical protein